VLSDTQGARAFIDGEDRGAATGGSHSSRIPALCEPWIKFFVVVGAVLGGVRLD